MLGLAHQTFVHNLEHKSSRCLWRKDDFCSSKDKTVVIARNMLDDENKIIILQSAFPNYF